MPNPARDNKGNKARAVAQHSTYVTPDLRYGMVGLRERRAEMMKILNGIGGKKCGKNKQ